MRLPDRWKVTNLSGKVGRSDVAGTAEILTETPRRKFVADLVSTRLDYRDLGGFVGLPPGASAGRPLARAEGRGAEARARPTASSPTTASSSTSLRDYDAAVPFPRQERARRSRADGQRRDEHRARQRRASLRSGEGRRRRRHRSPRGHARHHRACAAARGTPRRPQSRSRADLSRARVTARQDGPVRRLREGQGERCQPRAHGQGGRRRRRAHHVRRRGQRARAAAHQPRSRRRGAAGDRRRPDGDAPLRGVARSRVGDGTRQPAASA